MSHATLLPACALLMLHEQCYNFLTLAARGYYNDTVFHRLIPVSDSRQTHHTRTC